jgi:hypothetical protein
MRRPVTAAIALVTCAAFVAMPAEAAKKKAKPKPIKGSYTLNLNPDPTGEGGSLVGPGCSGLIAQSQDKRPFKIPAKGTFVVTLTSPDPILDATGQAVADWDLYLLDGEGYEVGASHTATANEEITVKFTKAQRATIWACNLIGQPEAKVTYTFTYA